MRAYIAFTKKEILENLRTYRLYIMGAVFLLLGMMNPFLAKILPDLLSSSLPELAGLLSSETTAMDSWDQFFNNVGQLGILTLVIIYSGSMANEFSTGTLINILTKGLKRSTVVLSKFTTITVIWTLSYLLCYSVSYLYTAYFWNVEVMNNTFISFSGMWLYGVLLIAFVIFGGILFKNIYNLLLTAGAVAVMMLLNISHTLHRFNPLTLASYNLPLLKAQYPASDFTSAFFICIGLIVVLIAASIIVFNKKQV